MKIKCDYCGQFIEDTDMVCPHCGATNNAASRTASGVPKTIEELKVFAAQHNLPLDKMRFFIGEDYSGPRAFGIYQDVFTGEFVVYKNKSDGSRSIRYKGKDEAYAVNELYQKMKAEVLSQKEHQLLRNDNNNRSSYYLGNIDKRNERARHRRARHRKYTSIMTSIILVFVIIQVCMGVFGVVQRITAPSSARRGYYSYGDTYYYHTYDNWYYWDDDYDDWYYADPPAALQDDYNDYYSGYSFSESDFSEYGVGDFSDSDYYSSDSYSSSDNDSSWWDDDSSWDDSDWDWDSDDDWDSGWTDWDSDW